METTIIDVDLFHDDGVEEKAGRSRNWMLLLYPDNEKHAAVLDGKLDELDWDYCGRVHDQDEGVKLHHHVIVAFKDGRQKADVAKDLDIEERWLRRVHSVKKAMRYLCHKDNPGKHQYSPDTIYGTIADKAIAQCSKGDALSEQEGVMKVHEIINNWPGVVTVSKILPIICAEGVYSHYRRLGNSIFRLIDEHNRPHYEKEKEETDKQMEKDRFAYRIADFEKLIRDMSLEDYLKLRESIGLSNKPNLGLDE